MPLGAFPYDVSMRDPPFSEPPCVGPANSSSERAPRPLPDLAQQTTEFLPFTSLYVCRGHSVFLSTEDRRRPDPADRQELLCFPAFRWLNRDLSRDRRLASGDGGKLDGGDRQLGGEVRRAGRGGRNGMAAVAISAATVANPAARVASKAATVASPPAVTATRWREPPTRRRQRQIRRRRPPA